MIGRPPKLVKLRGESPQTVSQLVAHPEAEVSAVTIYRRLKAGLPRTVKGISKRRAR